MAQKKTPEIKTETTAVAEQVENAQSIDNVPENKFDSVFEKMNTLATVLKEVQTQLKAIQKEYTKAVKSCSRKGGKKSAKPRPPSGFAKPCKLSDELCKFLELPLGTEKARTDVTKMLNEYIKKHNLQHQKDKRTIVPNSELAALLNLKPTDTLTYFNLQTFLKHRFETTKV
jgi:chromatin remodeling complex protein RSC6